MKLFTCAIPGRPIVKKNTKRVFKKHGRTVVVYTDRYLEWEESAQAYMKQAHLGKGAIDAPLEMRIKFYLKNRAALPDLSNLIEGPADVLKEAGVIVDDRQIQVIHAERFIGFEPRTEIELMEIA